jgi:hypothetical protein
LPSLSSVKNLLSEGYPELDSAFLKGSDRTMIVTMIAMRMVQVVIDMTAVLGAS